MGFGFLILLFSAFQTYAQKACHFLLFFPVYFLVSCECRWTASYWPVKMSMDSEAVRLQHIDDEERFRKTQILDQKAFQEKLEEMQVLNPWQWTEGGLEALLVSQVGNSQMRFYSDEFWGECAVRPNINAPPLVFCWLLIKSFLFCERQDSAEILIFHWEGVYTVFQFLMLREHGHLLFLSCVLISL